MARRKKKPIWLTILLVIVALGFKYFKDENGGEMPPPSGETSRWEKGDITRPSADESANSDHFSKIGDLDGKWQEINNCRLIKGRNSDGDSFHVRYEGQEGEFRLYFVDAPESAYRTYRGGENNGERIAEQGKYFGDLNQKETVEIGEEAKKLTLQLLGDQPFKLRTKWENVYGPERRYCLAIVEWQGREIYLHELLVERGLGRIHTRGTDLPSGKKRRAQEDFLKNWEVEAKKNAYGGWGGHHLN